jgi:hypothetical protein
MVTVSFYWTVLFNFIIALNEQEGEHCRPPYQLHLRLHRGHCVAAQGHTTNGRTLTQGQIWLLIVSFSIAAVAVS